MLPSDKIALEREVVTNCETIGIEGVRDKLAQRAYSGMRRRMAEAWLEEAIAVREREIDRNIARSGNRITFWTAVSGNVIAVLALAVATYAALTGQ